jgi:hypothetical protein
MDARTDFDWSTSTADDRKALYEVSRRLMTATQQTWPQIYRAALGHNNLADSYTEGFAAGRMSKRNCVLLHRWLRIRHPGYAAELDAILARRDDELPRLPPRFFRHAVPKILSYVGPEHPWARLRQSEMVRRLRKRFYGSGLVDLNEARFLGEKPKSDASR